MTLNLEPLARLRLTRPPVAVGFLSAAPSTLPRVDKAQAAGCGYWKYASEGHAFHTLPEDHENCPVGAFTHGVTLSPQKATELESLVTTMVELRYLKSDEVASIPHRTSAPQVIAYAPLGAAQFEPDTVVFRGNARQIMLITEAARAAGLFDSATTMGRPACAMIPQTTTSLAGVASVGCIGNRVYTDLGDDELYFAVPGKAVPDLLQQLDVVVSANEALEAFHRERAASLR